jgi:hypothetical protein
MLTTSSMPFSINDQQHALTALTARERAKVLRFAASFLWADLEVVDSERTFLSQLARELQVENATLEVASLLLVPPMPEEIDPNDITPNMADTVRQAALRAIASDGHVAESEMMLFELLDDLLPKPS